MIKLFAAFMPAWAPVWLASAIVYVIGAGVVAGGVVYLWESKVHHPYVAEGRKLQLAEDGPKIALETKRADAAESRLAVTLDANQQLANDVEHLRVDAQTSAATIDHIRKLADQARATAQRLMADMKALAAKDAEEITQLRATASGPPVLKDACAQGDRILSALAAWRHS